MGGSGVDDTAMHYCVGLATCGKEGVRQSVGVRFNLFPSMKLLRFRRMAAVVCALLCLSGAVSGADDGDWIYRPLDEVQAKADAGEVAAMAELARRLDDGVDGAERDRAAARVWYEKAATKGYAEAAYRLAGMLQEGRGVAQNPWHAYFWMKQAADRGLAVAQVKVGGMFERGEGTLKNWIEAFEWYAKAAEQGNADGMYLTGRRRPRCRN